MYSHSKEASARCDSSCTAYSLLPSTTADYLLLLTTCYN